ncbi:MAG: hypothetical protein AB2A00_33575 [Myxococcota bacterium]
MDNVATGVLVESNVVEVHVDGASAGITVQGDGNPEYRVCADQACSMVRLDWGSTAAVLQASGYVQLRLFSSPLGSAAHTATVMAGNVATDWTVSTGVAVTFLGFAATAADSPFTFPDQSLGTPVPGRLIAVMVHTSTNGNTAISGVTVGGVSGVKVISVHENQGAGAPTALFIVDAPLVSGADVVVQTSGSVGLRCAVGIWSLQGLQSSAPVDTATYDGPDPGALNVDVPAGGVVLGALTKNSSMGATATWSGPEPQYGGVINEGTGTLYSGAHAFLAQSQTGYVVTTAGGPSGTNRSVVASFR